MRYRILAARVCLTSTQSLDEYEARMNELMAKGYIPWGQPGVALDGENTVIVQHMTMDDDEEEEPKQPDDMD
jgi:hypothetical protein